MAPDESEWSASTSNRFIPGGKKLSIPVDWENDYNLGPVYKFWSRENLYPCQNWYRDIFIHHAHGKNKYFFKYPGSEAVDETSAVII